MRAKILSAGPSLMFMVLMRWSSFKRSKACPSISWDRNSSAISWQPAQRAMENDIEQLDTQHLWVKIQARFVAYNILHFHNINENKQQMCCSHNKDKQQNVQ